MEKERRRMKMIAAHFTPSIDYDNISSNSHLLIPMNCSGSLKSTTFTRCDNRLYYARQSSASQPFFMRQQHHNQLQEEKALKKCSESAAQAQPFYSRPATKLMEPKPKPKPKPMDCTQLPKFARPSSITFHSNGNVWSPRMDVAESGGSYIIRVEIPGVTVNDIRVELSETSLRIMGKRSRNQLVCGAYHKREIIQGPYQVSWPLPSDANKDSVSAEFLDGILQIIVPKL